MLRGLPASRAFAGFVKGSYSKPYLRFKQISADKDFSIGLLVICWIIQHVCSTF